MNFSSFKGDASARAHDSNPPDADATPARAEPSVGDELGESSSVERPSAGFSAVVRQLSLRGWLRWMHSTSSDATLTVRGQDGGVGRIWCAGGAIIDAEWDDLAADAAVQHMLRLSSGAVTIDFGSVDRPCRIATPMHELLHGVQLRKEALHEFRRMEAALAATPDRAVNTAFRNTMFLPHSGIDMDELRASVAPQVPDRRRPSQSTFVVAFALLVLMISAFALGRMRGSRAVAETDGASEPAAEQVRSGLHPPPPASASEPSAPVRSPARVAPQADELPLVSFAEIEVEPPHAEIWLDRQLIGRGRVRQGPIRDGMMHELSFAAPGYETARLFFRDSIQSGRVVLEAAAEPAAEGSEPAAAAAEEVPVLGERQSQEREQEAEGRSERRASRRRNAPPARAAAPAAPKPAPAEKAPHVKIIEVRTPRVRVIE